jgi:hypothetical protein
MAAPNFLRGSTILVRGNTDRLSEWYRSFHIAEGDRAPRPPEDVILILAAPCILSIAPFHMRTTVLWCSVEECSSSAPQHMAALLPMFYAAAEHSTPARSIRTPSRSLTHVE